MAMRGECLMKRGRNWYVAKEIAPLERNLHNGKKRIVRTLGTPHKIEALRRRTAVLAEIEVQLERARRGKHGVAASEAELAGEAMAHRWRLESERDEERALKRFEDMTLRSLDVEDRHGKAAAKGFVDVAMAMQHHSPPTLRTGCWKSVMPSAPSPTTGTRWRCFENGLKVRTCRQPWKR